jgi:hypothetical protein
MGQVEYGEDVPSGGLLDKAPGTNSPHLSPVLYYALMDFFSSRYEIWTYA